MKSWLMRLLRGAILDLINKVLDKVKEDLFEKLEEEDELSPEELEAINRIVELLAERIVSELEERI